MPPLSAQVATPAALPAAQAVTVATEVIILSPSNPAGALTAALGPFTALEQTLFDVIASGYITTKAAGTIALGLYVGAGATVVAGNLLHKTAAAVTQNTTTAPWWIHAALIYDSVSGKLQGKCGGTINNVLDPEIAITNVPTGVSNLANPVATFSLSITSTGGAPGTPTTINVQKFNAG
jgi:hypothetical protein